MGTWQLSGDAQGWVRYEWAEGRRFLLQHFDFDHGRRHNKGLEVIGHLQTLGGQPSRGIKSRAYVFLDGLTLDYTYEVSGDTLTIWGGERGSPAHYKGRFSADGNTLSGSWKYPGGGYSTMSTRIK